MKRIAALISAVLVTAAAGGCSWRETAPGKAQESVQVFAMDTAMVITAYGEEATRAAYAAEEEIYRLDSLLSRTNSASEISILNDAEGKIVPVGTEICGLIQKAGTYTKATGGAFDITIAPVVSAWGFTTDRYQVPSQETLEELLTHVGMDHVHLLDQSSAASGYKDASLDPGTRIDLGGIAKGYASDQVAEIFREHQVPRGLVSLGGNVLAWGDRPDGQAWRVGIQDPREPESADAFAGVLQLEDAFAVTSGSYERFFVQDGRTYHHIIDPATGCPAESGLTSVTVVADSEAGNGAMCDTLSTALFVMGEDRALEFWRSGAYDFEMVLVTEDGRVAVTQGLEQSFIKMEERGYTYEIIS